jgi:hypothetical protein
VTKLAKYAAYVEVHTEFYVGNLKGRGKGKGKGKTTLVTGRGGP